MSLYGNFTVKEWLALNCVTEDIEGLLRKALKDNDEPMAVLALAELIKRGDNDLVTYAIREAVGAGYITSDSHFSTVLTNALVRYGDRDPVLRQIGKGILREGFQFMTEKEMIENIISVNQGRPIAQKFLRGIDSRLNKFMESFMREGHFSIEFGFFVYGGTEWDPQYKEHCTVDAGEHYNLIVKNGFILNMEDVPNVISILNLAGIEKALPAFDGKELVDYTLSNDGNCWIKSEETKRKNFFHVSYYSVD